MKNLDSFLKTFNLKKLVSLRYFGVSAEDDWKMIFFSAIVLAVVITALSIFVFVKIDRGEIFLSQKSLEQPEKVLDIAQLKEVVSHYRNKNVRFMEILDQKTQIADPSL